MIRTTMTMIAKIGITPPPMKSNTSSSIGPSLWRWRRQRRRDQFDDEPRPGDPRHADHGADRDVDGGRGAEFVGLPLGLDEDAAISAGEDAHLDVRVLTDEVTRREGLRRLRASEGAEDDVGDD